MYFALPTRAAASQIHGRVNRFASNLFAAQKPEPVLAVPGYIQAGDFTGGHLQGYEVWWDTHPHDGDPQRFWAAESAKRFLAAQIAVGTVDQAMMAALQVRHSHMRAACLARNLLVVDEVHASDPYMSVILEALLNAHVGRGRVCAAYVRDPGFLGALPMAAPPSPAEPASRHADQGRHRCPLSSGVHTVR